MFYSYIAWANNRKKKIEGTQNRIFTPNKFEWFHRMLFQYLLYVYCFQKTHIDQPTEKIHKAVSMEQLEREQSYNQQSTINYSIL